MEQKRIMHKFEIIKLEVLNKMSKKPIKTVWKQMMPIPEKYIVLAPVEDESGDLDWFVPEKEGWSAPCLVLYESTYADGEVKSGIAIYVADAFGDGDLDLSAKLVPKGFVSKWMTNDGSDGNFKIAGAM